MTLSLEYPWLCLNLFRLRLQSDRSSDADDDLSLLRET
jgi:hypothetical protein